ncbi:MAG TPA: S41 family peptidase [Steroidobacteraceae bacterium]
MIFPGTATSPRFLRTLALQSAALAAIVFSGALAVVADTLPNATERKADLDFLVDQIAAHYAYLPERHLDLKELRAMYGPLAAAAATRGAFLQVIERVVGELHDHHATLGTNNDGSPELIPTGTELWAEMKDGRALLVEIRPAGDAAREGLHAGDEVVSIGGVAIADAVARAAPKTLAESDPEADNFALRTVLAGTHQGERVLSIRRLDNKVQEVRLAPYQVPRAENLITWRWIKSGIGYIRIENSLGDTDTVSAFDAALDSLNGANGLILDLRNTPSGGSTDVAEPILGRFINKSSPYQRVFEPGPGKSYPKDSWLKTAIPRAPYVQAKLVVLVDHWTGSMGEGIAIGFDALRRAQIVGTAMAGLRGGTGEFTLPNSKISVHIPVERLYRVNGTPRETFMPSLLVDLVHARGDDPILALGLKVLENE